MWLSLAILIGACGESAPSEAESAGDASVSLDATPGIVDGGAGTDATTDAIHVADADPGALGSACSPAASVCKAGLSCLYSLSSKYSCQPASTTCNQPALPTGLPVGFIYGNWTLPASKSGYSDVSLDMHPILTGPTTGSLQYFAFAGTFPGGPGGSGFYGGLQTQINNKTPASGKRGVIFSGFGLTDAVAASGAYVDIDLVSCDGGKGAVCAQLSLPYDWHDGETYRFRFHLLGDAPGRPGNRLLRTSVTDVGKGVESVLGDLILPTAWGLLPSNYGTFDETFPPNGAPETCQNYNPSDIEFLRLRGDSAAGTVVHADDKYPGPCVNNFHYLPITDGYRTLLGLCLPK